MGCYIWYSDEGPGRGRSPPKPLVAVPNITPHPPTASVPITALLYNGPFICCFNVPVKGLTLSRIVTKPRCRGCRRLSLSWLDERIIYDTLLSKCTLEILSLLLLSVSVCWGRFPVYVLWNFNVLLCVVLFIVAMSLCMQLIRARLSRRMTLTFCAIDLNLSVAFRFQSFVSTPCTFSAFHVV